MRLAAVVLLLLTSCSIVRAGWSPEDVRALQERLKENSFYSGPITGILDSDTQRAIDKATADFPEIKKLPAEKKEHFIGQILSWYNNAYELKRALSKSTTPEVPPYLRIHDGELPLGQFRLSLREEGAFSHIEHVYQLSVSSRRRLVFAEEFINHYNPRAHGKASIAGRYRIVRWAGRQQDTLFFFVTYKSGDVWTARDFMNLALRAGRKNLPVSFAIDVLDDNALTINGDRFTRVTAR